MVVDRVSDMVARLNNGQQRKKLYIYVLKSNFCSKILDCLTKEGFIRGYSDEGKKFKVFLKYKDNKGVIELCKRISLPKRRVYFSAEKLRQSYFNKELIVFSSSKGVFLNSILVLQKFNIGGEPLFKIK